MPLAPPAALTLSLRGGGRDGYGGSRHSGCGGDGSHEGAAVRRHATLGRVLEEHAAKSTEPEAVSIQRMMETPGISALRHRHSVLPQIFNSSPLLSIPVPEQYVEGPRGEPASRRLVVAADRRL